MKILVAKDEAFNFVYRANIDELATHGEVAFFSPIHDVVEIDCNLLYLPGGYPELFAEKLSANTEMMRKIKDFAEDGGKIYAECGGFMYLCRDIDGMKMCDVLPLHATMRGSHLHLGYRKMTIGIKENHKDCITLKGHEFHYSTIIEEEPANDLTIHQCQYSARDTEVNTILYRYKNVLAGYTHWYWAEVGFPFFNI